VLVETAKHITVVVVRAIVYRACVGRGELQVSPAQAFGESVDDVSGVISVTIADRNGISLILLIARAVPLHDRDKLRVVADIDADSNTDVAKLQA
jgi:hypothetical protein